MMRARAALKCVSSTKKCFAPVGLAPARSAAYAATNIARPALSASGNRFMGRSTTNPSPISRSART